MLLSHFNAPVLFISYFLSLLFTVHLSHVSVGDLTSVTTRRSWRQTLSGVRFDDSHFVVIFLETSILQPGVWQIVFCSVHIVFVPRFDVKVDGVLKNRCQCIKERILVRDCNILSNKWV
ncbi:hypothetical protein QBC42DRAFT_277425 [Cladorrhinum samala]|uniref:Secreted protein n=1 Tax=Cladorrhinum samala TaxID=585594 RepID=A0AAV9HDT5_9PEZI|nr:hypothetical protein QBC42DRAFT_277425 [Cladorrhinum samala]